MQASFHLRLLATDRRPGHAAGMLAFVTGQCQSTRRSKCARRLSRNPKPGRSIRIRHKSDTSLRAHG
jgi:hypothetical protein